MKARVDVGAAGVVGVVPTSVQRGGCEQLMHTESSRRVLC